MPWTFYKSSDASAPALTGQAGSLIALLDAILVTGYGGKPGAGWSKAFSGTNKAAYRMGSGRSRMYARIDDTGPGGQGVREARINAYESMSDVDTGVNNIVGGGGFLVVRKSSSIDAVARNWFAVADDRTFILIQSWDNSASYSGTYFGEFYSFMPNDDYGVMLIARFTENNTFYTQTTEALGLVTGSMSFGGYSGHYVARDPTTLVKQVSADKVIGMSGGGNQSLPNGPFYFPNIADGSLIMAPFYIRPSETAGTLLRGRLRGMWSPMHGLLTGLTIGDTFSGSDDLAGKSFAWVGYASGGSISNGGYFVIETSDTVPRN
jgi:hypothetical protein